MRIARACLSRCASIDAVMARSTQELGPTRFVEFGDPDYGYGESVSTDNEIEDEG